MNSVCDEDYDIADEAEEDLHYWILGRFDTTFDRIVPAFTKKRRYTL